MVPPGGSLMKRRIGVAMACVLAAAPAHGENYVRWHDREIDLDTIRTGQDGITMFESRKPEYYEDGTEWRVTTEAVDCQRRLVFSSYAIRYESDWRSKGVSYAGGTMGDDQVTFVCARRR